MKKDKPSFLKPLKRSVAIEKDHARKLKKFTKAILESYSYWTMAQFNKAMRGEEKNLSKALKLTFKDLLKQWESKAEDIASKIANSTFDEIEKYVNYHYAKQGYSLQAVPRSVAKIRNASVFEQIALIKSIPREILRRYEGALYPSVNNFNQEQIKKTLLTIKGISLRRAKFIARDQAGKALETYNIAQSQAFGFEYYIWQTAEDERVSTGKGGHRPLNGRIFKYSTPTAVIDSYMNKGIPSQRPNCRCVAVPLILEPNQRLKLIKDSEHGDFYEIFSKN